MRITEVIRHLTDVLELHGNVHVWIEGKDRDKPLSYFHIANGGERDGQFCLLRPPHGQEGEQ